MDSEQLIPILEPDAKPVSDGDVPVYEAGMGDSATYFISQIWDIPVENIGAKYNFKDLRNALRRNKSTEIIFRTAPKSIQDALLYRSIETAEPVYKLIHLTKAEYKEANDRNILDDWMTLQSIIDSAFRVDSKNYYYGNNDGMTLEDFCHYTNQEWFDIIEKQSIGTKNLNSIMFKLADMVEKSFLTLYRLILGIIILTEILNSISSTPLASSWIMFARKQSIKALRL